MAKKAGGKKPKREGKPRPKASKAGKAARPFLIAFLVTAAVAALFVLLWRVYGWDGYAPRLALSGWPAVGVLVVLAFLGVAYWRGGKAAFWGAFVATLAMGGLLLWATDSLPAIV